MSDRINREVPIVPLGDMELEYGVKAKVYRMNGCAILISHDPDESGLLWQSFNQPS